NKRFIPINIKNPILLIFCRLIIRKVITDKKIHILIKTNCVDITVFNELGKNNPIIKSKKAINEIK
ncbi:hypothetical protein, partial [Enterococcus faecium]|uniref:hypothetical protein n=1 Tax=Enterococcus faecium TaxID=1352 RepID=UPI0023B276D7